MKRTKENAISSFIGVGILIICVVAIIAIAMAIIIVSTPETAKVTYPIDSISVDALGSSLLFSYDYVKNNQTVKNSMPLYLPEFEIGSVNSITYYFDKMSDQNTYNRIVVELTKENYDLIFRN